MSLLHVFELIRKEDAVLWVGAGFSKYAGYPLGSQLSEYIYNAFTSEEKMAISKELPLAELCEEFISRRSRNQLMQLLEKIFQKKPNSLVHHKRLAQIPLVKTIVTTNYDNLFEFAFKGDIQKLVNNIDTSYIQDDKLALYKVHGDLIHPNSIVISSSDYYNFLNNKSQNNIYWSCVKSRLANKAVIMLGYSLSDPNIELIFEQIHNELEGNRKEVYLIAPGFGIKDQERLRKLEIKYIDMKGEVFIKKLQQNVYDNLISDFDNGNLKIDALSKILFKKKLKADFETLPNGKLRIKSISQLDGKTKLDFTFKVNSKDDFFKNFDAFIKGKDFGKIEIDSKDLIDFEFKTNGINLLANSSNGFMFSLMSLPSETGILDAYFEDGFELNDIEYKIYKSNYKFEAICTYKSSQLKASYFFENNPKRGITFNFEQIDDFTNVKEALECYEFLQRIANSTPLTLFSKNRNQTITCTPPPNTIPLSEINGYLQYYRSLQKIEILFKEKFRNISTPKLDYYNKMQYLINYSTPVFEVTSNDICFEIVGGKEETIKSLKTIYKNGDNLEVQLQDKEVYEVHGSDIVLGYRTIEFYNPYYINLDDLISGKDEIVKIKAQAKVKITYRK